MTTKAKPIPEWVFDRISINAERGIITRKSRAPGEKNNGKSSVGDILGSPTVAGYLEFCIMGQRVLCHRAIFQFVYGYCPEYVDHRDGDGTNNRIANLRAASKSQNVQNAGRPRRGHYSQFKGITYDKIRKLWVAQIKGKDGRSIHIGRFEEELAAAHAYDAVALHLRGEFAWLNFPGDRVQYGVGKRRAQHEADEARREAMS